ncbi:hypothetical protein POKO110462_04625 [Pontibacter korlensis]|uniref:Uncharacterized protein n=1 Tax=Pontibacter korlensis TaxID=400092 RepID=A0A0E3UX10_9BACT|nr:hypothetical protein [Pontibacter korlensis]AKD03186.1 hypothetical protein PKOR_08660 [Pontibacter korlensis]
MKKFLKKLPFLLLILLHASFLLAMLVEKLNITSNLIFIAAIIILVLIAYTQVPRHEDKHLKQDFLAVGFVVLGAVVTFYLNVQVNLGPVIAAGAVGTIASYVPWLNRQSKLLNEVPASTYCGAFVGMSSPNIAGSFMFILFASFIAGLLLVFSKNIFRGFGGKLGTIAFGGVAVTYLLIFLFL